MFTLILTLAELWTAAIIGMISGALLGFGIKAWFRQRVDIFACSAIGVALALFADVGVYYFDMHVVPLREKYCTETKNAKRFTSGEPASTVLIEFINIGDVNHSSMCATDCIEQTLSLGYKSIKITIPSDVEARTKYIKFLGVDEMSVFGRALAQEVQIIDVTPSHCAGVSAPGQGYKLEGRKGCYILVPARQGLTNVPRIRNVMGSETHSSKIISITRVEAYSSQGQLIYSWASFTWITRPISPLRRKLAQIASGSMEIWNCASPWEWLRRDVLFPPQ